MEILFLLSNNFLRRDLLNTIVSSFSQKEREKIRIYKKRYNFPSEKKEKKKSSLEIISKTFERCKANKINASLKS